VDVEQREAAPLAARQNVLALILVKWTLGLVGRANADVHGHR
jgi:hypothetical protein